VRNELKYGRNFFVLNFSSTTFVSFFSSHVTHFEDTVCDYGLCMPHLEVRCSQPFSGSCKCFNPSVFALLPTQLGTLVTGKLMRICGFHSSPTTSKHYIANAGNPLVRQLGRHLCRPKADKSPTGNRGGPMLSRPVETAPNKVAKSTQD
jgi:hypothetical protein